MIEMFRRINGVGTTQRLDTCMTVFILVDDVQQHNYIFECIIGRCNINDAPHLDRRILRFSIT
jgi:hypothetical protein